MARFDYVMLDIETTGLVPGYARIAEIAAIGVAGGLPEETFSTLVSIGGKMPEAAGKVNRITDGMLEGAPSIGEALDALIEFIATDSVLAGHNIEKFDIPFIEEAASACGREFDYVGCIDTLSAAKELWPGLDSYSMDSLRQRLGIQRSDAHRALADCYDELAVLNAEMAAVLPLYNAHMEGLGSEIMGTVDTCDKLFGRFDPSPLPCQHLS